MRLLSLILFFILTINCFSQGNKNILGSWIKIAVETYDGTVIEQMEDESLTYLKYTFLNNGNLNISVHYSSNGTNQKYLIRNNIIELVFNRKLQIEKIDSENLVLVDLSNGKLTPNSTRYKFIREQKYLDMLTLASEDKIIIEGDTAYIESEKLYPRFKNENYSNDYNVYLLSYIGNDLKEEIYSYATFVINPNGEIGNINILHHVSKTFDNKVIKAIKKSKGMWQLPKLNGKKVAIVKIFEERNINYGNSKPDYSNLESDEFKNYSMEYFENFNLLARSLLNKDYTKALEYISEGEELKPNEPNLFYLKHLCYESVGNGELSNENLNLLKETKLKYLIK